MTWFPMCHDVQEVVMVLLLIALVIALSVVVIKRAVIDYYKAVIGK